MKYEKLLFLCCSCCLNSFILMEIKHTWHYPQWRYTSRAFKESHKVIQLLPPLCKIFPSCLLFDLNGPFCSKIPLPPAAPRHNFAFLVKEHFVDKLQVQWANFWLWPLVLSLLPYRRQGKNWWDPSVQLIFIWLKWLLLIQNAWWKYNNFVFNFFTNLIPIEHRISMIFRKLFPPLQWYLLKWSEPL